MTLSISFYNNIKYGKDDFMKRDNDFFGNGVVNTTDFPITYPSPANMTLQLGAGTAWVDGYRIHNDSNLVTLTVTTADTTYPRIDIIQIGHDDVNSTYSLQVKKGVAAANPVEPGADPNYIKLYAISVTANVTSITSANVTDRRALVPLNVSGTQINLGGAVSKAGDTMTGELDGPAFKATDAFIGPNLITGFKNLLDPSKQSFTRASNATRKDLTPVPFNVLRTEQGKFGQGAFIEESTQQLVNNSDFETITGTATVFSDAMTAGTTADPAWTTQGNSSFTWSTSGATSGTGGAIITAGNSAWKPLTGSNGTSLALTAQATYTTQATLTANDGALYLFQSSGNLYLAFIKSSGFEFGKYVSGTYTQLATVTQTISASTAYTITLAITPSGGLTAKLYSGVGTGGTLLQTLTATDTSLTGGFLIGCGGDTGVVVSHAQVTAPFADGWTIGGDQRVAWALTATNPISGSYSVSAVGVANPSTVPYVSQTVSLLASTTYTISGFVSSTNVSLGGAYINFNSGTQCSTSVVSGSTSAQRYTATQTTPSTINTHNVALVLNDAGTAVFDAIQLEQKSYPTTYVRNDSTSASATRNADSLSYTLSSPLPSRYFGALVWTPEQASSNTKQKVVYTVTSKDTTSKRYILQYNYPSAGQFTLQKSVDGTNYTNLSTTANAVTFNALDRVFIAFEDDPTAGQVNLWIGVNGGLLQNFNLANTQQVTDAQIIFVGSYSGTGLECNGTIDYPIITDILPTTDQVQALYQASDWGGDRNYPGALPAQTRIGNSGISFKLTNPVPQLSIENTNSKTGSSIFLGAGGGVALATNGYFDGNNWERFDPTAPVNTLGVNATGAYVQTAPAGANPASLSGGMYLLQALSGGYKVQNNQTSIAVTTAGTQVSTPITFSTAFSTTPVIFVSVYAVSSGNAGYLSATTTSSSANGFTLNANSYLAQTLYISWIAIGS